MSRIADPTPQITSALFPKATNKDPTQEIKIVLPEGMRIATSTSPGDII